MLPPCCYPWSPIPLLAACFCLLQSTSRGRPLSIGSGCRTYALQHLHSPGLPSAMSWHVSHPAHLIMSSGVGANPATPRVTLTASWDAAVAAARLSWPKQQLCGTSLKGTSSSEENVVVPSPAPGAQGCSAGGRLESASPSRRLSERCHRSPCCFF